jgi:hypothetical protein
VVALGKLSVRALGEAIADGAVLPVVSVPLHPKGRRERPDLLHALIGGFFERQVRNAVVQPAIQVEQLSQRVKPAHEAVEYVLLHEVPDENFSSRKHYAIQIRYPVAESFLQEWDLRKKELAAGIISKSEYTEWKLNWPQTADDCGKHPPKIEWRDNPSGD